MINNWQQFNEKLGVSEDAEILSEFIIAELRKAEPGKTYTFQREDTELSDIQKKNNQKPNVVFVHRLPKLSVNLYKVIIDYYDLPEMNPKTGKRKPAPEALFDPNTSRYTKDGYIFKFGFQSRETRTKIWKHHVYHEVNHAFQFVGAGKAKSLFNPKYLRVNLMRQMFKNPLISSFIQLCYYTIKIEQGSMVAELYGKVKHRKDINSIEDLQNYFRKKSNHEYATARNLSQADLVTGFNRAIKAGIAKEEDIRIFFGVFNLLGNKIHSVKNLDEFQELIKKEGLKFEAKPISVEEYHRILRRYTKYFNRIGHELSRKLDKMYARLYDYFIEEFKNPRPKKEPQQPPKRTKEELKDLLDKAIAAEDYEKAIVYRDEMRSLG